MGEIKWTDNCLNKILIIIIYFGRAVRQRVNLLGIYIYIFFGGLTTYDARPAGGDAGNAPPPLSR